MKQHIPLLLLLIIISCGNGSKLFPKQVEKKISFNMPLADFKTMKNDRVELIDDGYDFRIVYKEYLDDRDVESIGYYFDANDHQPLYEMLIQYKDEAKRDAVAKKLFGEPNDGNKWRFTDKGDYTIRVWTYKTKLIITALIPETEWYNDEHR